MIRTAHLLCLFAGLAFQVSPPDQSMPVPKPDPIRMPRSSAAAPSKDVTPGPVGRLNDGEWYLIDSDVELIVRAKPAGLVEVKARKPGWYNGKFAGSAEPYGEKQFEGKFLYHVKPAGTGRVELTVIPVGVVNEGEIRSDTIDVNAGLGPQPPPVIDDKKAPVVTGKAWGWVLVEETTKAFPNRGNIMAAAVPWTEGKGAKHRVIDKDVVDASGRIPADAIPYLLAVGAIVKNVDGTYTKQAPTKPLPHLFVVTDQGGVLWEGDAPTASPAAYTGKLGEYIK